MKNLPRDSAYARTLRGEAAYWDETPEMLAVVADILQQQTWALLKAQGADIDAPEPLPRPGQKKPQPKTVSLSEWVSTL